MRNLFLICLLSFAGVTLAQEPVVQPEPVIEEQPAAQSDAQGDAQGDARAPEPVIEQQGAQQDDPAVDPPSRVARLSLREGDVSMAPAGTDEWADALLNRPMTTGDRLWVDSGARAELQVGSATLHLDQGTGLSFVDLDDEVMHLNLTEGSANVRIDRILEGERIEVDTPNATVTLLHPGEYHIQANSAGDQTIVRTRNGESEVSADGKNWTVSANQEGVFSGTNQLSARIERLGPRTAFEDWANDRNKRRDSSESARYVSTEVIGYEDLDRHGRWAYEPSYGYVWAPTYVAAGWAPYRYGRWVWVSPWGWSWVDASPWGFAPFHYGRWAYVGSRWCWVPGPRHLRPVYAPALVAWTGPASAVSVSFGGGIGWFPLGPREVYVPGYRYSRHYLNRVNVSNTIIVNNTYITNVYNGRHRNFDYRYGRNPRAVTIVDRDRFIGGRPLQGHETQISAADLRRWNRDPRPPALAPNRDSVFAARVLGRIPGRSATDPGVARLTNDRPATSRGVTRVPFDVERRQIEANGGRPIARSQLIRTSPASELARARDENRGSTRAGQIPATTDGRGRRIQRDDADRSAIVQGQPTQPRSATRTLSDRPSWAVRQRDESQRRFDTANEARSLQRERAESRMDPAGTGDPGSSRFSQPRRQETRENPAGTTPPINSLRRQSLPAGEAPQSQPRRAEDSRQQLRTSPVEQRRSYGGSGDTARREYRSPSAEPNAQPSIQSARPQWSSPPRSEQPRRYEPQRSESRPAPTQQQRSVAPQPRAEQRSSPSSQPRFNNSNSSRSQDGGRSGNYSGRQGTPQQRQ